MRRAGSLCRFHDGVWARVAAPAVADAGAAASGPAAAVWPIWSALVCPAANDALSAGDPVESGRLHGLGWSSPLPRAPGPLLPSIPLSGRRQHLLRARRQTRQAGCRQVCAVNGDRGRAIRAMHAGRCGIQARHSTLSEEQLKVRNQQLEWKSLTLRQDSRVRDTAQRMPAFVRCGMLVAAPSLCLGGGRLSDRPDCGRLHFGLPCRPAACLGWGESRGVAHVGMAGRHRTAFFLWHTRELSCRVRPLTWCRCCPCACRLPANRGTMAGFPAEGAVMAAGATEL